MANAAEYLSMMIGESQQLNEDKIGAEDGAEEPPASLNQTQTANVSNAGDPPNSASQSAFLAWTQTQHSSQVIPLQHMAL